MLDPHADNRPAMTARQWCIFAVSLVIAVLGYTMFVAPVMGQDCCLPGT